MLRLHWGPLSLWLTATPCSWCVILTHMYEHRCVCVVSQVEIIRVLGALTPADVETMPSSSCGQTEPFTFPPCASRPWPSVLRCKLRSGRTVHTSYGAEFEEVLSTTICWQPTSRLGADQAVAHPFFMQQGAHCVGRHTTQPTWEPSTP